MAKMKQVDLVGTVEIAQRLGVAIATVRSWRRRPEDDFPVPAARISGTPVWYWEVIEEWKEKRS